MVKMPAPMAAVVLDLDEARPVTPGRAVEPLPASWWLCAKIALSQSTKCVFVQATISARKTHSPDQLDRNIERLQIRKALGISSDFLEA
jgi:hypothetical protein